MSKYRNKSTGTIYADVEFNGTKVAVVTTEAGSRYTVKTDKLEELTSHPTMSSEEELEEILGSYSQSVQELIAGHVPFNDGIEASRYREEAKQAIKQWGIQQQEELLDRLERRNRPLGILESVCVPLSAIQAERSKLQAMKDGDAA